MMNKSLLKAEMSRFEDTQASLARALGISLSRLNAKINETRGAEFTQAEIMFIKERYNLNAFELNEIFFTKKVS